MCNTRIFRGCSRALYFYYRDAAFPISRIQIALCRPAFIRLLAVERARAAGGAGHFAVAFSRPLQYPRGRIQATKRLVDRRGSGVCSKMTITTQRHRGTSIRLHICVSTCVMFEGIHMCSCMRLLVVNSLASQVIDVVRTRHAIERERISVSYTAILARGFVA